MQHDQKGLVTQTDETLYDSPKSPTIAVTSCFQQEKSQRLSLQSSFKQKSVSFNEEINEFHDIDKVDLEDVWYSARDFQQFLSSTRNYGREIACNERNDKSMSSYKETLEQTYEACCRLTQDNDVVMMESNNNACYSSVLTLQEERDLQQCIEVSTSRLGIERLAILSIGTDCSRRKNELQHAVFEIQQMGLLSKSSAHAQAELLRRVSEKCSRTSRLFFQLIAEAQAHTVSAADKFF
jgi:hypothetical protein